MNRAVLLIGVSRTGGGMARLQAVESSIDKMQAWALEQGIPASQVIRRTDATGPVTIADLFNAVQGLMELDTVQQLIVYFAGHGVVNNRTEYWLLSDAPVNAAAAVNVENNVSLAQGGPFEHVVLLSDACRTPTEGLQYSRVIGSDIFPNIVDADRERSVDIFFGTSLGAPALEVQQAELGRQYQAVFTEALLDGLGGKIDGTVLDGRVRARPLKRVLPKQVQDRLAASGLSLSTSQAPDARITSDDEAWLAEIMPPATGAAPDAPPSPAPMPAGAPRPRSAPLSVRRPPSLPRAGPAPAPVPATAAAPAPATAAAPMTSREVARLVVDRALHVEAFNRAAATVDTVSAITGRGMTGNAGRLLERMATSEDLDHARRQMGGRPGFEIHGRGLAGVTCPAGACHTGEEGGFATVVVDTLERQSQALLEFRDGTGVLLPVIGGFVGVLRFDRDGLDEVWYEPADDADASLGRQELNVLRQAVIKASSLGVFELEGDDADQLAQRMQQLKFQDPALAVYAAYALHAMGQFRRIAHMQAFLQSQLGVQLYDLALLSRGLLKDPRLVERVVPRLPLLSQGWALTGALGGRVPGELELLRTELTPSLWSLYTPAGTRAIQAWLAGQGHHAPIPVGAEA